MCHHDVPSGAIDRGTSWNTVGLLDFEDLAELFCPLDEAFLVLDYRLGRTDSAEFGKFAPAVIEFLDGKAFEGGETMETFEHIVSLFEASDRDLRGLLFIYRLEN